MTCYHCGEPSVSSEHVPPLCFFPDDLCDKLITVPSCERHNGKKSKDDEYFRGVFLSSALVDKNPDVQQQRAAHARALEHAADRLAKQITSIEKWEIFDEIRGRHGNSPLGAGRVVSEFEVRGLFRTGMLGLMNRELLQEGPSTDGGISFAFDPRRLVAFCTSVARGLLFHERGVIWPQRVGIIPHSFWSESANDMQLILSTAFLNEIDRDSAQGAHKTIFYYNFFEGTVPRSTSPPGFTVSFCFFDAFYFTALFVEPNR